MYNVIKPFKKHMKKKNVSHPPSYMPIEGKERFL